MNVPIIITNMLDFLSSRVPPNHSAPRPPSRASGLDRHLGGGWFIKFSDAYRDHYYRDVMLYNVIYCCILLSNAKECQRM